jgi:transposase-like protein
LNARKGISARQLARDLKINKDTAWSLGMRIRRAMLEDRDLLLGIVEMDETYIGGKPRKGTKNFGSTRGRGTKKTPVVGMVERGGRVKAAPVKNVKAKTLSALVRGNVDTDCSVLITDQWVGYDRLSSFVNHETVNHRIWYVDGDKHINTIESFWAILKRGIVGQYHKVSVRYLSRYIDEFCYKYNNRKSDDLFNQTIIRALGATR